MVQKRDTRPGAQPDEILNKIDPTFKCSDLDCKATIKDHEVRLRNAEISLSDYKRLVDNIAKMTENSEETQRATVTALTDISQAVIRIDGKVDNLVERDTERVEYIDQVADSLKGFKKEYYTKEETYKIDTRSIRKDLILKAILFAFGSLGAIKLAIDFFNWLPK